MFSLLFPNVLLLALSGLLNELLLTLSSLSECLSPNIMSRFSMSESVSSPLDFLAFFAWLRGIRSNEIDLREGAKLRSKEIDLNN